MLVRGQGHPEVGLLDETFFMYGEDLDWAKRIKDCGWQVWYNPAVTVLHIKEAASRHSYRARREFYRALILFYEKHYRATTPFWLDWSIRGGVAVFGGLNLLPPGVCVVAECEELAGEARGWHVAGPHSGCSASMPAMSLLAFYIAYRLRLLTDGPKIGPFSDYVVLAVIQLISTLVVFFFYKFYHRRRTGLDCRRVLPHLWRRSVATLLTIAFIGFALRDTLDYQRSMIVYAWAATLITITLGRYALQPLVALAAPAGRGLDRVLIVGTGEVGRMILQKIQYTPGPGLPGGGFRRRRRCGPDSVLGVPVLGGVATCRRSSRSHARHEVIIGLPEATPPGAGRHHLAVRAGEGQHPGLPRRFQIMASEVTIGDLGGLPLLTMRDVALRGWKLALKRTVDIVVQQRRRWCCCRRS